MQPGLLTLLYEDASDASLPHYSILKIILQLFPALKADCSLAERKTMRESTLMERERAREPLSAMERERTMRNLVDMQRKVEQRQQRDRERQLLRVRESGTERLLRSL